MTIPDSNSSSVQVAVRIRPFLPKESGSNRCISILPSSNNQCLRIGGEDGPLFTFDNSFGPDNTQKDIYESSVSPLVRACLKGYNATVLAYGQTGSGKTFTVLGPQGGDLDGNSDEGVIPRALRELFLELDKRKDDMNSSDAATNPDTATGNDSKDDGEVQPYEYSVHVQFLELYGEEIRDLLSTSRSSSTKLTIRDGGNGVEPEVINATENPIHSAKEAMLALHRGSLRRVTGATAMNAESSRSHAIMSVMIEQTTATAMSHGNDMVEDDVEVKRSKFHFVDLAGSERQKKSLAVGKRLKEGIDINRGLLVLGNVISALGDPKKAGRTHVPYRDSKLTRLLKGSLGGNHRTLMIACVCPSSLNLEESLNCLRYANRAKNIQNNAVVNVDPGSRALMELRTLVQGLSNDLLMIHQNENYDLDKISVDLMYNQEHLKGFLSHGTDTPFSSKSPVRTPTQQQNNRICNTPSTPTPQRELFTAQLRLAETQTELCRIQDSLRQAKQELYTASEQLFSANAEKEFYRLNLASEQQQDNNNEQKNHIDGTMQQNGEIVNQFPIEEKAEIVNQFTAYEREISLLRGTIRDLQGKQHHHQQHHEITISPAKIISSRKLSSSDSEDDTEQREIKAMTRKYLPHDLNSDGDEAEGPSSNSDIPQATAMKDSTFLTRQKSMDLHLQDLTSSILAKESLIEQLQVTQDKYEMMRGFYESKLNQMETQVQQSEKERETLLFEMKQLKQSKQSKHQSYELMQRSLKEREKHITSLKKKQSELLNLSKVSTRNLTILNRLQTDLLTLKRSKVDLQKRMTLERKEHTNEIKKLKKDAQRKDRDLFKNKHLLHQKTVKAEQAQRMASSRLNEVAMLRTKYREAEKRLRISTLKKGMMNRVGIDSVMTGSRKRNRETTNPTTPKHRKNRTTPPISNRSMLSRSTSPSPKKHYQLVRSYLDEKISQVGKKESIAEKVAKEWEDHMELSCRKQEMNQNNINPDANSIPQQQQEEELEAINVQIRYKEQRIRTLTKRLTTPFKKDRGSQGSSMERNTFLEDKEYKSIFSGATPLTAAQITSKVLFGLVVRERKRVATLARTACSLDQKVTEGVEIIKEREDALQAQMEEQKIERVSMSKEQQEHILSLMNIVKEDGENDNKGISSTVAAITNTLSSYDANSKSSENVMLILANEQIALLECQLVELQADVDSQNSDRIKHEKHVLEMKEKDMDNDYLRKEVARLKVAFRQLREVMNSMNETKKIGGNRRKSEGDGDSVCSSGSIRKIRKPPRVVTNHYHSRQPSITDLDDKINDVIERALHSAKKKKRTITPYVALSYNSDSSGNDDEPEPEWAGDIMADLAFIAEGQMPPSMQNGKHHPPSNPALNSHNTPRSPRSRAGSITGDPQEVDVFDRLTDPDNFTGIQKHNQQYQQSSRKMVTNHEHKSSSSHKSRNNIKSKSHHIRRNQHPKKVPSSVDDKSVGTTDSIISTPSTFRVSFNSLIQSSAMRQLGYKSPSPPCSLFGDETDAGSSDHHSKDSVYEMLSTVSGASTNGFDLLQSQIHSYRRQISASAPSDEASQGGSLYRGGDEAVALSPSVTVRQKRRA